MIATVPHDRRIGASKKHPAMRQSRPSASKRGQMSALESLQRDGRQVLSQRSGERILQRRKVHCLFISTFYVINHDELKVEAHSVGSYRDERREIGAPGANSEAGDRDTKMVPTVVPGPASEAREL